MVPDSASASSTAPAIPTGTGIVGYGVIGRAFCELLRAAGGGATIYERSKAGREEALAAGYSPAASAATLAADCTLVAVAVRDDAEVLEAVCGAEGALAGAKPGTTIVVHSTVHPQTVREVAERAEPLGVATVEAPIVGKPDVVRAKQGVFLLGGSAAAIEDCAGYLRPLADRSLVAGPLGAGNVLKLMRNLLLGGERLFLREVLQLGEVYGVDYVRGLETLREMQTGEAPLLERWRTIFDETGATSAPDAHNKTHLYDKDIPLARLLGEEAGRDLPIVNEISAAAQRLAASSEPDGAV